MERIDYRYSFLYNCSTKKTNLNRVQKLWLVVLQEHENMAACTQRLGDNNISVTILRNPLLDFHEKLQTER